MHQLKMTVNEEKTQICRLPTGTFDFLGYTFGRYYSTRHGRGYLGARPSKAAVRRLCRSISDKTGCNRTYLPEQALVGQLNRMLSGWAHYFSLQLGPLTRTYDAIDAHVRRRVRQWLGRKYRTRTAGGRRFTSSMLYKELSLLDLRNNRHRFLKAKA
jgi:RNA-directed DNA polymerase